MSIVRDFVQFLTGASVPVAVNNVNDTTPTQAEILTAFGVAAVADLPEGAFRFVNDNNGNVNQYLVWKAGTKVNFVKGTVAA